MARHLIRIALVLALVAGCSSARQPAATAVFNATDVMFLQMSLAQIEEGDRVAALAASKARRIARGSMAVEASVSGAAHR